MSDTEPRAGGAWQGAGHPEEPPGAPGAIPEALQEPSAAPLN